jgi:hypothetical protein
VREWAAGDVREGAPTTGGGNEEGGRPAAGPVHGGGGQPMREGVAAPTPAPVPLPAVMRGRSG